MKTLAGVTSPTAGTVTVNGEPAGARLTDIGYLPQDEIVHPDLTVSEALDYSAQLRLPADTGDDEIEATVDRALEELGLEAHANTRIGSLSGGQRKRVGRRDRAAQPAEPAVPGRAHDRPRSRASSRR